ncbi:MAG: hypothetical protein IEMM0008_0602 [bacterium]|nr:MAG: hypothetical protein IEMM0008_0602 [bacterium]
METMNIKDFLNEFSLIELKEKKIIAGGETNQLKGSSVLHLINLMKEKNVQMLEYPERSWFINIEGHFKNPCSPTLKEGEIKDLTQPGHVFWNQNAYTNPHYFSTKSDVSSGKEIIDTEAQTFKLEKDLQNALRMNIEQLEKGLKSIDSGKEFNTKAGRTDILAEDEERTIVVIELKAGKAKPDSIAQILAYIATLSEEEEKPVRGILVAGDFDERVIYAARTIPNLQLKKYNFNLTFKEIE